MLNLDEEMKKLKERGPSNPLPLTKMAKITAASLDRAASQWAFNTFRNQMFRRLSGLEQMEKIEQDRIFNELVLAGIVLLMITLEAQDLNIPEEMKEYFRLVKDEIPQAHLDTFTQYGIEKKYLADWKKLIQMRFDEYDQDKLEIRKAAMDLDSKNGELTKKGLDDIHLLLPVQTVAIGCHHHICRSKTEGKNELFKFLTRQLGRFYVTIRVPLEGGKITFLKKIRMQVRHFLNDLRHK